MRRTAILTAVIRKDRPWMSVLDVDKFGEHWGVKAGSGLWKKGLAEYYVFCGYCDLALAEAVVRRNTLDDWRLDFSDGAPSQGSLPVGMRPRQALTNAGYNIDRLPVER